MNNVDLGALNHILAKAVHHQRKSKIGDDMREHGMFIILGFASDIVKLHFGTTRWGAAEQWLRAAGFDDMDVAFIRYFSGNSKPDYDGPEGWMA